MGTGRTDEFRKDAVRIALTSGLTRRQVADDLGVGLSTLNKWVTAHRDTDVISPEDRELARENERLRRENRILKEERDLSDQPPVSGHERQHARVAGFPQPSGQPQAAHGYGCSGAHQGTVASEPGQLRQATNDRGTEGGRH